MLQKHMVVYKLFWLNFLHGQCYFISVLFIASMYIVVKKMWIFLYLSVAPLTVFSIVSLEVGVVALYCTHELDYES